MMKKVPYSYDVDEVTVPDLNGSWYQMGCQYGALAKEKITDVLAYIDLKLVFSLKNQKKYLNLFTN
ncbi:MAG: hypothetical protein KBS95_08370 [Alistipes sp.]|nr:hypothetical protein [Candidatus Alistipes equi]